MRSERTIDVSDLSPVAIGHHAPLWWGTAGMMAIEATMFALVVAVYLYYGTTVDDWPPTGVRPPSLTIATVNLVLLVVSCFPTYFASEASARDDPGGVANWLLLNLVCVVAFLVLRIVEWRGLAFTWDSHVYGSLVWTIFGLHTTHVVSATFETLIIVIIVLTGRFGDKQRIGVDADSVYWYFVVGAWLPFYVLLFLVPALR
ncbi:MAG TPA: cytochrome c oxidase subunit 3 [Candidatus Binatia bacterium]|nr:cytochrome c oxidase subunit 3 [Candidatus Binatia bacterium]